MLVGIDASRATRTVQTGTESYSRELISALVRRGRWPYRLYLDRAPGPDFPTSSAVQRRVIPMPRLWTHLGLASELYRRRPDLLFVPSHVIPLTCPVPAVVTIHDVGYLWHRSAYSPLAWILLRLGTRHNLRTARIVVSDSWATARELMDRFKVPAERLRVAQLGGPTVQEVAVTPDQRRRHGLVDPYFLFVGTLQPRKNLERVLRAFGQLARTESRSVGLALAGQAGVGSIALESLVRRLGLSDQVHFLGYVPRDDLPALYAGAVAFLFPSLYEGFGLPALEAMAWGTPVIASNTSALPEVVGDAGLLVDPYDVEGITRAMAELLNDPSRRHRLIGLGRRRAAEFTWDRCASDVESAFDDALERRPGPIADLPRANGPTTGSAGD